MKEFNMQKSHKLIGTFLYAMLVACGSVGNQDSKLTKVIGTDDRTTASRHFEDSIGSLRFGDFHICSAYLSATNVVSTARHCSPSGENLQRYSFVTQSGRHFKINKMLSTDQDRITSFETFEFSPTFLESTTFKPDIAVEIVSYSSKSKSYLRSIDAKAVVTTQGLVHQLDTEAGSSGAPVLQDGKVVAVHEGGLINAKQNYATLLQSSSKTADINTLFIDQEWKCNSKCDWYQPDCYAWKELNCNTGVITICGRNLVVPMISYYVCQGALAAIPATCTAGTVMTAGTACFANAGIAAAACAVSVEQIYDVGKACINNL
jgi:V8-like Glu-specific endopeptidase